MFPPLRTELGDPSVCGQTSSFDSSPSRKERVRSCAGCLEIGRVEAQPGALGGAIITVTRDRPAGAMSCLLGGRRKKKPRPCADSHGGAALAAWGLPVTSNPSLPG